MNRKLILALAVSLVLSACSELATKEAPIEDRAGSGQAITTTSSTGTSAVSTGTSAAEAGNPNVADAAAGMESTPPQVLSSGQADVQTRGTDMQGVEVNPLPENVAGGTAGGGMGGAQGAGGPVGAGGSPEEVMAATYANMQVPPQDPSNPLARRIILFDFDSSVIKDEYRSLIEAHALFLKSSTNAKSILQGHTDERGSRDYNLALGQRRAESVQQAMVLMGVDPEKIEAVSLGEEKPVAEGHDESAWAQNRRVEIYYRGE